MQLKLLLTNTDGTQDVTALISSVTLSGDYRQCCRTLEAEVLVSPYDEALPSVYFPLGGTVQLSTDGELLFYGHVVSKSKATDAPTMTVTCFDRGFYLKQNYGTYNFKSQTPEAITRRVCRDFGIACGTLAATGQVISRKFSGVALYSIIDTAYTLASEQTGKRYLTRFAGPALTVIEKAAAPSRGVIEPGTGLMTAAYSESIENMVNRVSIYDSDDKFLRSLSDDDAVKLYGLMRSVIRQGKDEDAAGKAKKMLEDGGVERRVTVKTLGDPSYITGGAVQLREPFTGQIGLFWIDTDKHIWRKGIYTNELTLNFRNMMREGEAGTDK